MRHTDFFERLNRYARRVLSRYQQAFSAIPQYLALKRVADPRFRMRWTDRWLCFGDATAQTGFDRHYVFHTAWASRVLAATRPAMHVDISSSVFFVTMVSAFVPVRFYDYRPAQFGLSGLESAHADLTKLPFDDESVESLSCMHVVEHVGLGRYGDPLDYDGDLKAISELKRVVAREGQLLFVVPMGGEPRIQFNAHRIYTYRQIVELFSDFELVEFSLIQDGRTEPAFVRNATESLANAQGYGCGCFWFRKPAERRPV
ncbi:DUF268 domain-containing protein [Denitromonas iodatirespirans]|uniref:DUF268 domain-containing protein n=1 Tax=Denitromonas iodatirespirans TaxID=2795389 RepID=A0A944DGB7_DENI1|nr:DUF268 domain-containing protein [Denitromonas iodatirespirans]MBT0962313.1 DUF268 domain-containing protein [Denitromonas iodatirespirans]